MWPADLSNRVEMSWRAAGCCPPMLKAATPGTWTARIGLLLRTRRFVQQPDVPAAITKAGYVVLCCVMLYYVSVQLTRDSVYVYANDLGHCGGRSMWFSSNPRISAAVVLSTSSDVTFAVDNTRKDARFCETPVIRLTDWLVYCQSRFQRVVSQQRAVANPNISCRYPHN